MNRQFSVCIRESVVGLGISQIYDLKSTVASQYATNSRACMFTDSDSTASMTRSVMSLYSVYPLFFYILSGK